jgi:hypothetical protein
MAFGKKLLRRDEAVHRFGVRVTALERTIADVTEVGADPSVVIEAVARARHRPGGRR